MTVHDDITFTLPKRAFLVGVCLPGQALGEVEEHLAELEHLAESAGVSTVGHTLQRRDAPHPKTFVGAGKVDEIAAAAKELGADAVLFDDDLSASQVKNLEKAIDLQIVDRSALILEIFGQRARSREARTQVSLARLQYMLPRLTRRWGHLGRQAGGIGVRGGEGESQLEADRRMLRKQIGRLKKELVKIERTRDVQRGGRRDVPVVALAGYTNAGKSTLFNRLTGAGTLAENRLFATLDAKLRRGWIGEQRVAVFADTVGFIRKLPHHLVSSFRSTLGEITEADLVLHVVDRSHDQWRDQMRVADEVMNDLGVEAQRIIPVFNKVDRLDLSDETPLREDAIPVSAKTGEGLDELRAAIRAHLDDLPFYRQPAGALAG